MSTTSTMSTELRLTAIIALLSSSVLRGTTVAKTTALRMHLETALKEPEALDPHLRLTLEAILKEWKMATDLDACSSPHVSGPAASLLLH